MRTRNRGQRISVVSALGIRNPSKYRRRSALSMNTTPFRGRVVRRGSGRSARSSHRIERGGIRGRIRRGMRGRRSSRIITPHFTDRDMMQSENKSKKESNPSPSSDFVEPIRRGTGILRGRMPSRRRSLYSYRGRYSGNSFERMKTNSSEIQSFSKERLSEFRSTRGGRSGKRRASGFVTPLRFKDLNETPDNVGMNMSNIDNDRPVTIVGVQQKRKRGRPPLSSVLTRNINLNPPPTNTKHKSPVRFEKQPQTLPFNKIKPNGCYEEERLDISACADHIRINPSFSTESLRFGAVDNVLQEIMDDVNRNGYVPKVNKLSKLSQYEVEASDSDLKMQFSLPIIANIFDDVWQATTSILRNDSKDLFLALNGLMRPGVCEVWRRRREHQSKQLSRSIMGRLRPNPRPRRYSDMVLPRNDTSRSRVASGKSLGEKLRKQTAHAAALSAARLTAAKKLILAKSHHNVVVGSPPFVTCRPQLSIEAIDSPPQNVLTTRTVRPRKTAKISAPFPVNTRQRRRPDISHHIDWKFCYNTSQKPEQSFPNLNEIPSHSRRKSGVNTVEIPNPDLQTAKSQSPKTSETLNTVQAVNDQPPENVSQDIPSTAEHTSEKIKQEQESEAVRLLSRFSCESNSSEPRKRRHAITVQRKRPVDRSLMIVERKEPSIWSEGPVADTNSESPSPPSSLTDVYGRSFRGSSWYHHKLNKTVGNTSNAKNTTNVEPGESMGVRLKPSRIIANNARNIHNALSRRTKNVSLPSTLATQSNRVPRRSDRCQLTLLDRLVLGFNCSVSSSDNDIHVRRLHKNDLHMLVQRMNGTGYSIKHLALRNGSSEDAEYSLVLAYSNTADPSQRANQTSSSRRRALVDYRGNESQIYPSNERYVRRKFKKHRSETPFNQRAKTPIPAISSSRLVHRVASNSSSSEQRGYHSDSELIAYPRLRDPSAYLALSDSEESCFHKRGGTHEGATDKIDHPVTSAANTSKLHSERSAHSFSVHSGVKNVSSLLKPPLKGVDGEYSASDNESVKLVSEVTARNVQLNSKHAPISHLNMGPFRRHSPRKVIRKVYTGNVTIPKILNRKRPVSSIGNTSVQSYVGLNSKPLGAGASATGPANNIYGSECLPQTTLLYDDASHEQSTVVFPHHNSPAYPQMPYRHYQQAAVEINDLPTTQADIGAVASSVFSDQCPEGRFQIASSCPFESVGVTLTHPVRPSSIMPETVPSSVTECVNEPPREAPQKSENSEIDVSENDSSIKIEHADAAASSLTDSRPVKEEEESLVEESATATSCAGSSSHPEYPVVVSAVSLHVEHVQQTSAAGQDQSGDESHTPATSLSASQLLKLKRRQEDCGRSPPHLLPGTDSHGGHLTAVCQTVSSSSTLDPLITSSSLSQTKSIDSVNFNCLRQPSQSSEKPTPALDANRRQFHHVQPDSGPRTIPGHLVHLPSVSTSPGLPQSGRRGDGVTLFGEPGTREGRYNHNEEEEDFELKTVTKAEEAQRQQFASRPADVETTMSETTPRPRVQTTFSTAPVGGGSAMLIDTPSTPTVVSSAKISPAYCPVDMDGPSTSTSAHQAPAFLARFQTPNGPVAVRPITTRFNYNLHHQTASPAGLVAPQQSLSFVCPLVSQKHSASGELLTASQVVTRVVVQNPSNTPKLCALETNVGSLSGRPFICGPVDGVACDTVTSLGTTMDMESLPRVLNSTTAHPSVGATALGQVGVSSSGGTGPLRRTIVHKYHSFRKILPKSSEHPAFLTGQTTAARLNSPAAGGLVGTSGLASLPVSAHGGLRLFHTNSVSNLTEPVYDIDPTSTAATSTQSDGTEAQGSIGHIFDHVLPVTCYPNAGVGNTRPQLLKTLLESVDAAKEASSTTAGFTSPALVEPAASQVRAGVGVSAPVTWNQPAHQSRGTWQLGKRPVSNTTNNNSGLGRQTAGSFSGSNSISSREAGPVFMPRTVTSGHSVATASLSSSSSTLPPPASSPVLRFTPGSASRLQQLQQHYQRKQQEQQQQQQQQQQSAVAGAPGALTE